MIGEVQILRPLNCVLSGLVIIISAFIILPFSEISEIWWMLILGALSAGFVAGAGNAINDYADTETDAIAHPERPLPSGMTTPGTVLKVSLLLFIVSLIFTAVINVLAFTIAIIAILLEIGYVLYLHKSYLGKNIIVGLLVALLFIFGGAIVGKVWALELWILAILTFIANLAREIIKDVEDIRGDRYTTRKTVPLVFGIKWANWYASFLLGIVIALSPLPFLLNILSAAYIPLGIITDIFLLYSIIKISKPTVAQQNIRYAMMVALGAFFVGSVL